MSGPNDAPKMVAREDTSVEKVDPFQKMMMELNNKLSSITNAIVSSEQNLDERISASEKRVIDHIDSKYNELSEQIVKLEERISSLECEKVQQSQAISELQMESAAKSSYISTLEMKINKCNVILFNFEESEITPEDLLTNLIKFFNEVMKVIMKHTDIDVVYRLGKEQPRKIRPVFISLTTMKMRDYIFSCRRNLKDTKIYISEDCPKEIIAKRKQLLPALLGAKKLKKKAFFKYGTLVVNGKACTDEEIEDYCKSYTESSKRPRSVEVSSPTNVSQETKKQKSLSLLRASERRRSMSLSNSPGASTSRITQFFNTQAPSSPNSGTFSFQSNQ